MVNRLLGATDPVALALSATSCYWAGDIWLQPSSFNAATHNYSITVPFLAEGVKLTSSQGWGLGVSQLGRVDGLSSGLTLRVNGDGNERNVLASQYRPQSAFNSSLPTYFVEASGTERTHYFMHAHPVRPQREAIRHISEST